MTKEERDCSFFSLVAYLPCLRPAAGEEYPEQDVPPVSAGWPVAPENANPSRAAGDWRTTWPNSRANCRRCSASWYSISRIQEAWDWDSEGHLRYKNKTGVRCMLKLSKYYLTKRKKKKHICDYSRIENYTLETRYSPLFIFLNYILFFLILKDFGFRISDNLNNFII